MKNCESQEQVKQHKKNVNKFKVNARKFCRHLTCPVTLCRSLLSYWPCSPLPPLPKLV